MIASFIFIYGLGFTLQYSYVASFPCLWSNHDLLLTYREISLTDVHSPFALILID